MQRNHAMFFSPDRGKIDYLILVLHQIRYVVVVAKILLAIGPNKTTGN